jgi:hypothetical protein
MWRKQIRAERAAEAASQMVAKANALQKAVMDRPGSSGIEGGASEDVSENEAESRGSTTLVPSLASRALARATEGDGDSTMQGSQYSHAGDSIDFDKSDDRSDDQDEAKEYQTQAEAKPHDTKPDPSKPSEAEPSARP